MSKNSKFLKKLFFSSNDIDYPENKEDDEAIVVNQHKLEDSMGYGTPQHDKMNYVTLQLCNFIQGDNEYVAVSGSEEVEQIQEVNQKLHGELQGIIQSLESHLKRYKEQRQLENYQKRYYS